jgi:hypothetical protein
MGLGDREARVDVRLVWGPLSCTVAGHAVFGRIQPTAHVFMLMSFPELDLDYRCAFDLAAAAADMTNLRSEGRLRCGHRRLRRCPAYLTALVENHLRAVGAATSSRAQGHYQAQVRLGGLDNRFPEPSDRSFGEARAHPGPVEVEVEMGRGGPGSPFAGYCRATSWMNTATTRSMGMEGFTS